MVLNSDVTGPAWPKSRGFGPASVGLGPPQCQAKPQAVVSQSQWLGPAQAVAHARLRMVKRRYSVDDRTQRISVFSVQLMVTVVEICLFHYIIGALRACDGYPPSMHITLSRSKFGGLR